MYKNNEYVVGYVAIKAKPNSNRIFTSLSEIKEVTEFHPLFGDYNLLVKVQAETSEKFGEISDKIGKLEDVLEIKKMAGIKPGRD